MNNSYRQKNNKLGFPGGSDGKESACNVGDPGSIPGSGRCPGEGNGNPLQYSFLAWRISWTDEPGRIYSQWGHKELDTTERLTVLFFFFQDSSYPQNPRVVSKINYKLLNTLALLLWQKPV